MAGNSSFTGDPKKAKEEQRRVIDEKSKMRDADSPGSHDPSGTANSQPGDDRREEAQRKTGLGPGFVRRTD